MRRAALTAWMGCRAAPIMTARPAHQPRTPDGRLPTRRGIDGDGLAEHEVDHGLDAPGDVVLDDDLAPAGGAVVGERPGPLLLGRPPDDARRQADLLRQAVPAPGAGGARGRQRVPVVRPELVQARE